MDDNSIIDVRESTFVRLQAGGCVFLPRHDVKAVVYNLQVMLVRGNRFGGLTCYRKAK